MFSKVHHVAIIGTDYQRTKEFYVDKLGFKVISENIRIEKNDIILNVQQGNLVLEIFIKEDAPARPKIFDNKKMAFFFDPDGLPLEIHE